MAVNSVCRFEDRIFSEIRKIETDRYDEGVRIGHDPRSDYDYDTKWIEIHGKEFDINWNLSLCKSCTCSRICGFKTATKCNYFSPI